MLRLFKYLDTETIRDSVIILDIDGTLVSDGTQNIDEETLVKIQELKERNYKIYLFSNKKDHTRNHYLAQKTNLSYLDTPYKKPNPEILTLISNPEAKPVSVIGDKWLTDGVFAKNIKAQFIKVKRVVGNDGLIIRLINTLDDCIYLVHNLLHPSL